MNRLYHIGLNVRTERVAQKITQSELAEKCGVTPETICSIENGKRCPSVDLLIILASVLNTTIDSLVSASNTYSSEIFAKRLFNLMTQAEDEKEIMDLLYDLGEVLVKHFGKKEVENEI